MINNLNEYSGKTIKIAGKYSISSDNTHIITVTDALGCCSQDLEFELSAENYPNIGSNITIEGRFYTYSQVGKTHSLIANAVLII